MDPKQIAKQMIQFTKATFDNTLDAITVLQEQTEKLIGTYLEQTPIIPAEGKKTIADLMKAYKKGCEEFKNAVDDNYKKVEKSCAGDDKVKEPKVVKISPAKKAIKEPKAVKATPAKKVKRTAKKKPHAKKVTNIDKVVGLVRGSIEGISTAELKEKTGLAESQIWNIVNSATKAGKVKKVKRGIYGAA